MSKIEEYQNAIMAYEQAKIACGDIANVVERANAILINWTKATVSNIESSFPPEIYGKAGTSIDAHEWPTADQLSKALQNYHTTKAAVKAKHSEFTIMERRVLIPPPA